MVFYVLRTYSDLIISLYFGFVNLMSIFLWFDGICKSYDLYYVELMPGYPEKDLWIFALQTVLYYKGFLVNLQMEFCRIFSKISCIRNFSIS